MVTKAEVEAILEEDKVIGVNLRWTPGGAGMRLRAAVLALESRKALRLRGYVGPRSCSFALLYENSPIRRYCAQDSHRNPDTREVIEGPHKHAWDARWQDRIAYVPDDIRMGDPNEELEDFLAECNIRHSGSYEPLLVRRL